MTSAFLAAAVALAFASPLRAQLRTADPPAVLPWTTLTRVDVERGRHASVGGAVIGGVAGLLGGALVGGLVGLIGGYCRGTCRGYYEGLARIATGVFIGAGVGTASGMYLGSRAALPVREPVRLAAPRATPWRASANEREPPDDGAARRYAAASVVTRAARAFSHRRSARLTMPA